MSISQYVEQLVAGRTPLLVDLGLAADIEADVAGLVPAGLEDVQRVGILGIVLAAALFQGGAVLLPLPVPGGPRLPRVLGVAHHPRLAGLALRRFSPPSPELDLAPIEF